MKTPTASHASKDAILALARGTKIERVEIEGLGAPIFVRGLSARERDAFEAPRAVQDLFYDMLLLDGMHVGTNRIMFLSALHDESHMSDLLQASLVASRRLRDAGMLGHL